MGESGWLRKSLYSLEISESTNDIAMKLAANGCPHGTVVISKSQINGKGRQGRQWQAWPGALALSIVLRPRLHFSQAHKLVLASALGVADALEFLGVAALIKWPNDIVIHSLSGEWIEKLGPFRKAGGILLELSGTRDNLDAAVIGIGLNIERPLSAHHVELLPQMGFLSDLRAELNADSLAAALLDSLEISFADDLLRNDDTHLLDRVKEKSMLIGKKVRVSLGETTFEGIAVDLDHDGSLVVQDSYKKRNKVHYGDVSLIQTS